MHKNISTRVECNFPRQLLTAEVSVELADKGVADNLYLISRKERSCRCILASFLRVPDPVGAPVAIVGDARSRMSTTRMRASLCALITARNFFSTLLPNPQSRWKE